MEDCLYFIYGRPYVSKVAQQQPAGENDLHHHYIHMLDHDRSHQLMMDKFQSKVCVERKNLLGLVVFVSCQAVTKSNM